MRPLPWLTLVLGLSTVSGAASPRQEVERPPLLSVKTDLVMLPVTVVDRRGRFVAGLTRDDFIVYDNGERRAIEFFTADDLPATIGLVIDSSGSMRGKRAAVTAAGAAFAAMSHPLDQFFTMNFNEAAWPGLPPSISFTADVGQLHAALSAAPADGMTALYDALHRALTHVQLGTHDRKALIVVGDGGDNASTRTLEAVLELTRRAGAAIYPVIVFDPDDHDARPSLLKRWMLTHSRGSSVPRVEPKARYMVTIGRVRPLRWRIVNTWWYSRSPVGGASDRNSRSGTTMHTTAW